jgi:hypothetical protein
MNYRKVATDLYKCGLSVLPIGEDKMPIGKWKKNQTELIEPDSRFNDCLGIGMCCGTDQNIQCVDIDCKYDLTGTLFADYKNQIALFSKDLLKKMTVQKTQNNGYHFIFRCAEIAGNQKIANRLATADEYLTKKEKTKTLIETREAGGYIMIAPSPGYEIIYGDLTNLMEITPDERQILLTCASTFNEFFVESSDYKMKKEVPDISPFEDYNNRGDIIEILKDCGWTETGMNRGNIMLLRPGGEKLWSAGYHPEMRKFRCFSQSTEFDVTKSYMPATVLTLVKFNGDYKEAAKWLFGQGYGKGTETYKKKPAETKPTVAPEEIESILLKSRIDTKKKIERPPTILSVREPNGSQFIHKRLFTLGNFSCIIGKAKAKKTFFLIKAISVILSKEVDDRLYAEVPPDRPNVIYFDTEQGEYDSTNCMRKIEILAGNDGNFKGFNLRQYEPKMRCEIVEHALKLWGKGTCVVVVDGIADLANGINDEDEATRVTTLLLRWTKEHNCHMVTVIHQNKNDNYATGHLGSAIMKKAEIIVSASKSTIDNRISDIKNEMSRGTDFEPFSIWINDDGLPEIIDYVEPKKSKKKKNPFVNEPDESEKEPDYPF